MVSVYENIIFAGNGIILLGTLIVGLVVLYQGVSRRMGNLIVLGFLYLLTSASKVIQFALGLVWAQVAFFQTAIPILILEFTRRTFFKGRSDARKLTLFFYTSTIAFYLVSAYYAYRYSLTGLTDRPLYNIAASFDILTVVFPNIYTIIASREAIRHLDPKLVEGYIIERVRLWMYLGVIFGVAYFLWIVEILIPGELTYAILNSISTIIGIIHISGSYLLWILPSWFRDYLNRDSKVEAVEATELEEEGPDISEEELIDIRRGGMLKYLGSHLADYIGTSELASRGHLRFAARHAYPDISVREFNYQKWENVLGEPLISQINKLSLSVDPMEISDFMRSDLKKSQAIITMVAK